jgi:hypothetical protein
MILIQILASVARISEQSERNPGHADKQGLNDTAMRISISKCSGINELAPDFSVFHNLF